MRLAEPCACYVDAVRTMLLSRTGRAEDRLLEPADLEAPRPAPGQVIIDIEACGVCRTDLHIVEGEVAAALPIVPGHQAAGRIAEIGKGVGAFAVGDAVGVGWLFSTCGTCAFCDHGRENLCREARFTGRDVHG